jgi:hypothetical protein
MKTFYTIILASLLTVATNTTTAQSNFNNETITAETFIRMSNGAGGPFAISPIKIENAINGFAVKWQTVNESNIAAFELETSEDKKAFTSVKKLDAGNAKQPASIYEVNFSMNCIHAEKTYFRVKTSFANGTVTYSDIAMVKVKKAK